MAYRLLRSGSFRSIKSCFPFMVLVFVVQYYLLSWNPSCQNDRSDNHRNFNQAKSGDDDQPQNSIQQNKISGAVPAMISHPGLHVATSGMDLYFGETIDAYFLLCGPRVFRFRNYLSVLSAIYVVKPTKIILIHTHEFEIDDHRYNTWLQLLFDTVPNLATMKVDAQFSCNADIKEAIFTKIQSAIFIGLNTIMAEFPVYLRQSSSPIGSANTGEDEGFLYIKRQQNDSVYTHSDVSNCATKENFDTSNGDICLVLDSDLAPKDIWTLDTPFGNLARKLAYQYNQIITPRQDYDTLAPRIGHFFWFGAKTFSYGNYLSVLSALYVAGLGKIYFHGVRPKHYLFEKLIREENVTHVIMPELRHIYNHQLKYTTHNADIGKLYVLTRYGGVTQDTDVFWTRRISDELLAYEGVVSFDWPEHGEFPEVFNLGVLMGKPNAFYFKALLNEMKDYHDDTVHHLAMRLPYKTFEQYPSSLKTEHHLQVICWLGKCHPSWLPEYIKPLNPDLPGSEFDWEKETFAVHCTWPKPPFEMSNFETLRSAEGLFADIGRNILRNAGQL